MMRTHSRLRMRNGFVFSPLSLFIAGEQGVWYDPSDLGTLFQDAAGTVPVTTAGQPVGLILDKRLGLVRGLEQVANGDFSTGTTGWTAVAGSITAVGGRMRVARGAGIGRSAYPITCTPGRTYAVSIDRFKGQVVSAPVLISISPTSSAGAISVHGTSSVPTTDGTLSFVFVATQASHWVFCEAGNGVEGQYAEFDNVSVRELTGNHATQPTAASRPMLRQNATTGAFYLETDGSDDWMSTAAIDFTATDKVSVFAGVRKLSDAATGIIAELSPDSNSNAGSFMLLGPSGNGLANYGFRSRGTLVPGSAVVIGHVSPHSAVVTAAAQIGADVETLRVNGGAATSITGDQGAGNYGNYPLYLFRRGGTTLPFNGHFYGVIIVGRLTTDIETRNSELMLANRTGVTLA